jgi:hypothetical protein
MVGRALCAMGLACALAGILLEGVSVEIPGIALGAVGYGFATRSGDRAGQVLGVATVVLCAVSMASPRSTCPRCSWSPERSDERRGSWREILSVCE